MMTAFAETHPYNCRENIPEETRILIVGTAPPPRFSNPSCKEFGVHDFDFDFFYGSGSNYFWKWMNEIATEQRAPLPPDEAESENYVAEARTFLRRHKIWMKDVLQTYKRKPGKACSASDGDIVPPRPEDCTNLLEVLKTHPSICRIVFTSNRACEWTFTAMRDETLTLSYRDAIKNHHILARGKTGNEYLDFKSHDPLLVANIHNARVCFFIAPSPSGNSWGLPEAHKKELYKRLLFLDAEVSS